MLRKHVEPIVVGLGRLRFGRFSEMLDGFYCDGLAVVLVTKLFCQKRIGSSLHKTGSFLTNSDAASASVFWIWLWAAVLSRMAFAVCSSQAAGMSAPPAISREMASPAGPAISFGKLKSPTTCLIISSALGCA